MVRLLDLLDSESLISLVRGIDKTGSTEYKFNKHY